MMNLILKDLKKYKDFVLFHVHVNIKLKVSNTILGYLWWLIDPFMQMLVYTFIVVFIFDRGGKDYPLFVFCGLLSWKWLSSTVTYSAGSIKANANILNQVYLPKFIFPLQECISNLYKFCFGLFVMVIMMAFFRVSPSIHNLEIILVIAVNFLFIYGLSLHLTHYGVFIADIKNILSHALRIWWYISPGIYNLTAIPEKYRGIFWLNPNTVFFESYRNVLLYHRSPYYSQLLIWFVISLIMTYFGLKKLYRHDRHYSKMI